MSPTGVLPVVVLRGSDGSSVRLDQLPVILGRAAAGSPVQPDCDLGGLSDSDRVSRQHASLDWHQGALVVTDLGSTNGTMLDGRRLEAHAPTAIGNRARLTLGRLDLVVEMELPPTVQQPETATVGGEQMTETPAPARAPQNVDGTAAARAGLTAFTDSVFRLFLDDQTEEIVLSPGRKLAVRRQGEWLQAGNSPTTREEWAAFWTVFCRAAHIDPRQSGYVSVLLQERVVAEAILPPLSWQPLFMARKRPAARGLGELVSGGQLTTEQATTLREATAAGRGILVSGPPDSGRTTLLEAVVDAIPRLARIALVERRTQLRTVSPLVARLRDRAASAVTTALTVSPDWIVVDDGLAETLSQAVLAGVPTIVAVRGDAEQWRDRAARLLGDDGRAQIDDAFAVTVRLETTDGGFRCVEVT